MDFTLAEAQIALSELTRKILADHTAADGLGKPLWTDLARSGVLSATLPVSAGGDGLGLLEQCSVLVEIGRAALGLAYLDSIVVAASGIAEFGSPEQVQRWAAPAGRGELVLTAALSPGTVQVRRMSEGWALSGALPAVPAATYTDAVLVPTDDGVFVVMPTDGGVTVEAEQIAGGPGAGVVTLSDVELPTDRLIAAATTAGWLRDRATIGHCAMQVGVLERALELAAGYARARVQFGKAIGSFQAVAQRLADAYIDLEGVRLTMWQAAWRLSAHLPCPPESATAKFWAADAGHRIAHTIVHVHGGVGIDLDHIVQRYFLAAKYHEFTLGGATEQLLSLGTALVDIALEA